MGVDTKLYLPPEARLEDVLDVFVTMLGGEVTRRDFSHHATKEPGSYGWAAHVQPVPTFQTFDDIPTMVRSYGNVNGAIYNIHYHFEGGVFPGWKQMSTGYRDERKPLWIAMADFFGGMVDLNDCDDIDVDHIGAWSEDRPYRLNAEDGDAWEQFQEAMLGVEQVISVEDWNH